MIAHPPGQLAQRNHIVPMIINGFWEEKIRHFDAFLFVEKKVKAILNNGGVDGWSFFCVHSSPGWEKFIESPRFEAVAAQDMVTNFGAFFDDTDGKGSIVFLFELFDFDGSTQSGDASTNDENVVLHLLSWREGAEAGREEFVEMGSRYKSCYH